MAALSLILALSLGPLDWPYLGSGSLGGRSYRSRTRLPAPKTESSRCVACRARVVSVWCRGPSVEFGSVRGL